MTISFLSYQVYDLKYMTEEISDDERILIFLTGLYPDGLSYTTMFENAKKAYINGNEREIEEALRRLLENQKSKDSIYFLQKRVGNTYDTIARLTQSGIALVWDYMQKQYEKKPYQVMLQIKKWMENGDKIASKYYHSILHMEMDTHVDVYTAMLLPHTLIEVIQHTAFFNNIRLDDDEKIQQLQKSVIETINRGLTLNLIKRESKKIKEDNGNGKLVDHTEEYLQLTKDGLQGMYNLNTYMRKGTVFSDEQTSEEPMDFKDVIKEYADIPSKKVIVWAIVSFFMTFFIFLGSIASGKDTSLLWIAPTLIFAFIVVILEIFKRLNSFRS